MKRLVLILVSALLVLAGCSSESSSSSLEDGVLTVGMECNYAPYNWTTDEENKSEEGVLISGSDNAYCNGYDVMIAQTIADELGVELEIKAISWDGLIPALQSGEIDCIIAGMSATAERKETISFTDPYFEDEEVNGLVVLADSEYVNATSVNDFEGAKVSTQLGTLQESLITQLNGAEIIPSMTDYAALQQSLLSGQIDGYVSESSSGEEALHLILI